MNSRSAERRDHRLIVEKLIDVCMSMTPMNLPAPPTMFDGEAQAEVIAAAWDGFWPSEPFDPDDFWGHLHRGLALVLVAARAAKVNPTIELVLKVLETDGIKGVCTELAVRKLLENTPTLVRPDRAAHRVRSLAWRRRLVQKVDVLRSLLLEPAVDEETLETTLDDFVALAAQQPAMGPPR